MKKTGVFYHEILSRLAYDVLMMGVKEGFESLEKDGILKEPNVILFNSPKISESSILRVHPEFIIDQVKETKYYGTSLRTIGGVISALENMINKNIDNALVFIGVGGHHAGRKYYWGGCFFNTEAVSIEFIRNKYNIRRFAIIDTDTHHADGTREIYNKDNDILHICFCHRQQEEDTNVCIPHTHSDDEFVKLFKQEVPERIARFKPEIIIWICGMDTHHDSYGTQALTELCFPRLAREIKNISEEICHGSLLIKNSCNAPGHVTEYVTPRLVDILAELNLYKE